MVFAFAFNAEKDGVAGRVILQIKLNLRPLRDRILCVGKRLVTNSIFLLLELMTWLVVAPMR